MELTLNVADLQEINDLLTLDDEALFSILGGYADESALYQPIGQIEAGKKLFQNLNGTLHEVICEKWKANEKIDNPKLNDSVNLVVAIGDTIASLHLGFPPFVIAAIIVKIGIREFCKCGHSEKK